MVFTDDDLAKLKDALKGNLTAVKDFESGWLLAILARMEAAEKRSKYHIQDCHCEYCLAWRKAAGKF